MAEAKTPEERWGIAHIYSSFNNTMVHITDLTGAETVSRSAGGQHVKADRLQGTPAVQIKPAQQLPKRPRDRAITPYRFESPLPAGTAPGPPVQGAQRQSECSRRTASG